jgi:hypothetical protein
MERVEDSQDLLAQADAAVAARDWWSLGRLVELLAGWIPPRLELLARECVELARDDEDALAAELWLVFRDAVRREGR